MLFCFSFLSALSWSSWQLCC